jgi:hypothetical protein
LDIQFFVHQIDESACTASAATPSARCAAAVARASSTPNRVDYATGWHSNAAPKNHNDAATRPATAAFAAGRSDNSAAATTSTTA